MTREQMIDACAEAAYAAWADEEVQRRREEARRAGYPVQTRGEPAFHALGQVQREVWQARARPIVLMLERENVLRLAGERLYDVEIDDPDMGDKHVYEGISACSAWAAAHEGARRAIRDDPTHGMPMQQAAPFEMPVRLPTATDRCLWHESPGLVEAVVMYAKVWAAGAERVGEAVVDPNAPWVSDD